MTIIDEMNEKYKRSKKNIPVFLQEYFRKYIKDLNDIKLKKLEKGDRKFRVKCLTKNFKLLLQNNGYNNRVYEEVDLFKPIHKMKDFSKNITSFVKNDFPLKHIYNHRKQIDLIAIEENKKKILFIEIKASPTIKDFFDAFLEFSMIDINKPELNNYTPFFILLSDYGGNPFHGRDKNRPIELGNEFIFVKDLFKSKELFTEGNVHFILLDPEHLILNTLNQTILQ